MSYFINKAVKLVVFLFLLILPLNLSAANFPDKKTEDRRTERLVALGKLWGAIKYFHPALAYRTDIDWDKALIDTIPKVNAAKSSDEYKAALQSMLDVLGDPLTRADRENPAENSSENVQERKLGYKLTEDKILIIAAGSYFELYSPESQKILAEIPQEISNARAVVFDLRSDQPPDAYGVGALTSGFSQILRLISPLVITTPGERSRLYYGYESTSPFASGQYRSGFFTQDGKRITPARNAKDIPSVTVLNKNSGLLASTLPLQAAGKGLIVFDGDAKEGAVGKTDILELGDGVIARVRLSELIYEDGASGEVQPDVIVTAAQSEKDKAIETALELARNFKPSTVVRKKLPSSALPPPEKSYPQEYPSLEYRLLAAFRIWNTINYFFPYKHLIERNWEGVLREFVPKFERSKDALEYSLTVAEMVTYIHDSHAYVRGSVFDKHFGLGYPPIRVRVIENTPVVVSFRDESAARSSGAEIGDIVLKVDGEDAKARLARYAKYISASTPQNKLDKAALSFMNGAENSVVTLTVRDRANREKEVKLTRKYEDFNTLYHRERSGDVLKLLPGNIGYADLDRLTDDKIDEMLEMFKNTRGIIFDVRGYPNGIFYWLLTPRLTEKQNVAAALLETPLVGQNTSSGSSEAFYQMIQPAPPGKWIYKGKTVLLIDERSISRSEHTGLFFRAANGTKFIGSPTAGADGEVTTLSVPGAITVGFSGQSVKFPDGTQLQRVGLVPDIKVTPTIRGIRSGKDEVLEEAARYLKSDISSNKKKGSIVNKIKK
jgi:C-terminal processing protease CtpA/Prc